MRFATRMLLQQLATVLGVVAVCALAFGWFGFQQIRAQSEAAVLNIARTVAEDRDVRDLVAEFSADPGTPQAVGLRDGALQRLAVDVAERTGALFVVITDDHGIRLAHPNQDLLGQVVSTPFDEVLRGNEVVDWAAGTLGESVRGKVPVLAADGTPIGEVSVGIEATSVFDNLPALVIAITGSALAAFALAALATALMRRRYERLTLGLQPEELVALVQNQAAVLEGVGDGVLAVDENDVVRVCNEAAERMLRVDAPVGRPVRELGLEGAVLDALRRDGAGTEAVVGDRVLYLEVRAVARGDRPLGRVLVLRDRSDLEALAGRLDTVRATTEALRVHRHEFANRVHVVAGLLDAGRVSEARAFLGDLAERGAVDFAVEGIERVSDPFLQSFIAATAFSARERGVPLRVGADTLLIGNVRDAEDVAAILGNLVGNAVSAAVAGDAPRWVEIVLLSDDDALVLTVADSGGGIRPVGVDPFDRPGRIPETAGAPQPSRSPGGPVHGHGIGLVVSRELARRHDGDVWLIDPGGHGAGAVFGARLPGAMGAPAPDPEEHA